MKKNLSLALLKSLRPKEKAYCVANRGPQGLRVRVAPSGLRTWNLAYRIKGVKGVKSLSLGPTDSAKKRSACLEVLLDELPPGQRADDGVRGEMGCRLEG
jgi:hypothetical protein